MSYLSTPRGYYEQFQLQSPLEEGDVGWTSAPWPGWGQNPLLAGQNRIAMGASPDGIGAYYATQENQAIGADEAPSKFLPVLFVVGFGVVALVVLAGSAKQIGQSFK